MLRCWRYVHEPICGCLARLPDGQVGCIFDGTAERGEFDNHQGAAILLARFTLAWLTDGKDTLP